MTNQEYPKKIKIVEVGPRDGLQNEAKVISSKDKIEFIKKLANSGLTELEIGAFVHPKAVPQMADSDEVIRSIIKIQKDEKHKDHELFKKIKFSALVPNMKGLERALETGIERIAVFTAASDTFNQKNINVNIKESLGNIEQIIKAAHHHHISVRGYISTCFVCPYEGEVDNEKVINVSKELNFLGVDEISIGDTIGAAAPSDVHKLLSKLTQEIPKEKIALHFHDTYGTALSNVVAGLAMGISIFDSSAGGLGGCPYAPGASGNLATEDLLYLMNRMGIDSKVDINSIVEASSFMQKILHKTLPSKNLQRILAKK